MSNKCAKCKGASSNRDLLRCFGKCKSGFHPGCIDYKMDSWFKLFRDCPYAKFVCLDCQDDLDGAIHSSIETMKEKIDLLAETVQTLTTNLDTRFSHVQKDFDDKLNTLCNNTSLITAQATPYREALQSGVFPACSSESIHPRFQPGLDVIIGSCNESDLAIKSVPDRKFIYASRFENSTTPEALIKFLSAKLDIADFDCRLLVSAKQDVSRLNFVSFKIGVNPDVFTKLLQPTIWPYGVLVREFQSRAKNLNPAKLL